MIELLVVISIIALLMSILLPALSKVKSLARKAVCSSNFHQIGIIHSTYSADWNRWLPNSALLSNNSGGYRIPKIGEPIGPIIPYMFLQSVYDYIEDSYQIEYEFWICPTLVSKGGQLGFLKKDNFQGNRPQAHGDGFHYYVGLANLAGMVNMTLGEISSGVVIPEPTTVKESAAKVGDRGDKLLAADLNIRWTTGWNDSATVIAHRGKSKDGYMIPEGGNRVRVDGAVEWVKPDVMAKEGESILQDPQRDGKYDHWPSQDREYYW